MKEEQTKEHNGQKKNRQHNTMGKRKTTKEQTTIHKTLHRKLKSRNTNPAKKRG